jgi:hypothetical protein
MVHGKGTWPLVELILHCSLYSRLAVISDNSYFGGLLPAALRSQAAPCSTCISIGWAPAAILPS